MNNTARVDNFEDFARWANERGWYKLTTRENYEHERVDMYITPTGNVIRVVLDHKDAIPRYKESGDE